jgi:hypothetical protein
VSKVRIRFAAILVALAPFLAACPGSLEGNIVDIRSGNLEGYFEVAVKDLVDGEPEWVTIKTEHMDTCTVGAQYPQCTQE